MNELLPRFKGLKSLHLLGKGKKFKKRALGNYRRVDKEKGRDTILSSIEFIRSAFLTEGKGNNDKKNEILNEFFCFYPPYQAGGNQLNFLLLCLILFHYSSKNPFSYFSHV